MPPVVIDLKRTEDPRDVVHRAVQALAEGRIVGFPSESVYGAAASALEPSAVERLARWKGADASRPLSLALKSGEDALDYVPAISPLARRLARRCWPGPLTMIVDDTHPDSALRVLPDAVRAAVAPRGTVALRVPAHATVQSVLRLCAGPVVWTNAHPIGSPPAVTATEAVERLDDHASLVLDDGRCRFAQPPAVVRVDGLKLIVRRMGVLTDASLRQMAGYMLLFVCTGNTCRSPMAERLMRNLLARKFNVPIESLESRGILVMSAGVSAMSGSGPSAEAVAVLAQRGLDLRPHESQPLSERLARFADLILTMTRGHRDAILAHWPFTAGRVKVVSLDGADIADPIGGPLEMYQHCADQIERNLIAWLDQLDIQPLDSLVLPGE
ncbi:MAG: translation factor [Planctomycetes bacterium]|nr:translation factor [Planctomycetota bacterium]